MNLIFGTCNKGRRLHHESGSEDSKEGISLSGSSEDGSSGGSEGSTSSLGTESTGSSGSDDALGSDSEGLDETDEPEETRSEFPARPVSRYDFTEQEEKYATDSQTWWDAVKLKQRIAFFNRMGL
jgi:hypothetical protein